MEEPTEVSQSESCAEEYPNAFQRKVFWIAITALSIAIIGAAAVGSVILGGKVLGYLQPVLVPLAIAGILAYLLEPVVVWLTKKGWKPNLAMLTVFIGFLALVTGLVISVIVPTFSEAKEVYGKRESIRKQIVNVVERSTATVKARFGEHRMIQDFEEHFRDGIDQLSKGAMDVAPKIGEWVWHRLRGAFGFFGYLLGLLLVPIYLFYFLREGHKISEGWSHYLPLRQSTFKEEVVTTLNEINGYLISFFRGQMVVSLIDGALVAAALLVLGLPYAVLIGVFLAILGLIPYIGNLMVMIPAILIAVAHFGATSEWGTVQGDTPAVVGKPATIQVTANATPQSAEGEISNSAEQVENASGRLLEKKAVSDVRSDGKEAKVLLNAKWWMPHVWVYPLAVLLIFVLLQQVNGLVTAPKIVGDSVGLHPLTVIFSVLFWSLVLGGLLGALLAVPLTAAIKVLFRRYVWERRLEPAVDRRLGENSDDEGDPAQSPA